MNCGSIRQSRPAAAPATRRRAFTLVELLVVIAVIAVLISLLLPAVNKARRSAMTLKCLSNARTVGLAFSLYCHENKGRYPKVNTTYYFDSSGWDATLEETLGKKWNRNFDNAFYCPFHSFTNIPIVNPSFELHTRVSGMAFSSIRSPSEAIILICGVHRRSPELQPTVPFLFGDGHASTERWPVPTTAAVWTELHNRGFQ